MDSLALEKRTIASGIKYVWTLKVARLVREIRVNKICYLFLAPFALVFTIFTVIPVLMSIALSFTNFDMIQPPRWVGWDNYIRLFLEDEVFLIAVKNTFIFAAITGPFSYIASLLFAWLINELRPRIRAVLTLLFFAPSISGNAFLIWTLMFSGDAHGYINGFLLYWGFIDTPILWFMDPRYMMSTVILVVLWMSLSISFLAFIAGLQGIDETLYEAGAIDGIRNRWQELWYLTLPAMRPQLLFGAIISITGSFAASGQIIALVGFPDTEYATRTVVTHLLDYGNIRFEMGYAAAIATLLFFSMIWAQKFVQKLLRKIG
ncbi:MAG: Lactose transport system permease protein LacF [Syntrophomonadaceae bacterium]|nr:Lactose transport system permease protein LacF [Bacillota bacterium]